MKKYIFLLLSAIPFVSSCQQKNASAQDRKSANLATGMEFYNTAVDAYGKGIYDSAIVYLTKSLDLTPKEDSFYEQILHVRGIAYIKNGDPETAVADLQQLVQRQPTITQYLVDLSYALGEAHRYAECLAKLEQAKSIDSSDVYVYVNLSYYSGESGAYTNAASYARKGLSLAKDSPVIGSLMNNLGYAQSKAGSVKDGLHTISSSLQFFPQNSFAYFNLGRIYLDIQDKTQACANFQKAYHLGGVVLTEEYITQYCK